LNGTKRVNLRNLSAYEEHIFAERLLAEITAHDPSQPLFVYYPAHIAHLPYEVPQSYLDAFSKAGGGPFDNSTGEATMRMTYHAMVKFLDDVIGNITAAFKAKGMWESTLMFFASDNGGPIYAGGNNYPLRGGKYSEFEGGVRVAAFASGGFLPKSRRGQKSKEIAALADIYTTMCSLAGVDPIDQRAQAAGLPPVDGVDMTNMLINDGKSNRIEVPLKPLNKKDLLDLDAYDKALRISNIQNKQCVKIDRCAFEDKNHSIVDNMLMNDCCTLCNKTKLCAAAVWSTNVKEPHANGTCQLKKTATQQVIRKSSTCWMHADTPPQPPIISTQAGIIVNDLKLITGEVSQAVFLGPTFPNHTTPWTMNDTIKVPTFYCSLPHKRACLFNVTADPTEHKDLAMSRPEDVIRLLDRLRWWSSTQFDPYRGTGDPRACTQVIRNRGFFGPWLELS